MTRLIIMDLDDTLLRKDKTISEHTMAVLNRCRQAGILIGFCTARGERNSRRFIDQVRPDVIITSGGALVRCMGEIIYEHPLNETQVNAFIAAARRQAPECEITVDGRDGYYWNYKKHPGENYGDWGEILYTDYSDFHQPALRLCMELPTPEMARRTAEAVEGCESLPFAGGNWYRFALSGATKEDGVRRAAEHLGIAMAEVIAYGDDTGDIGMIRQSGTGVAMGNAIETVLAAADRIAADNDSDGIARDLERYVLAPLNAGKESSDGFTPSASGAQDRA